MNTLTFSAVATILGAIAILFASRLRMIRAGKQGIFPVPVAERYQPMLRLMRPDEFAFAGNNKLLREKMEAQRRQIFRAYLRCLTKDYGQLLAGIRVLMVHSETDRPDLAGILARNRLYFALTLCRVELRLALHQLGLGSAATLGAELVGALETLRKVHATLLTPASGSALLAH